MGQSGLKPSALRFAPAALLACRPIQAQNYSNELSFKVWQRERRFLSAYDLDKYTSGATKEGIPLHSQTVQAINAELVARRKQFKKTKLRWRVSSGARRALGWIPFKAAALRYKNGQVWYAGAPLSLWDSYGLAGYQLGSGSFSEDSRGRYKGPVRSMGCSRSAEREELRRGSFSPYSRICGFRLRSLFYRKGALRSWYLNITVKVEKSAPCKAAKLVGIDLGLKDFLTTSDGLKINAHRFYRDQEEALAVAQRSNKKQRVKAIHAKIKARRKDALHKLSTELVREYGAIFVGDVNASSLAKTKMAKSVLDAGWSAFRTMLSYKCDDAGVWFEEVREAYSTQTCSCCGSITGPKGVAGLGIRGWRCSDCGTEHDRDVNAAKNILAAGRGRLVEGILGL